MWLFCGGVKVSAFTAFNSAPSLKDSSPWKKEKENIAQKKKSV